MESYDILRDLAIILVFAKILGIFARKLKAPQVVGEIIAGLILGPSLFGLVESSEFILQMAEIGVVLLMFMAGLETKIHDLLKTGPKAFFIACGGIVIPLISGYYLYNLLYGFSPLGSEGFYRAIFIGIILTATSVSITVQTLREMGHLKGEVGTLILSAAIIDDVIGIILLTFIVGFKNPQAHPASIIVNTVLFFIFCFVVGFVSYYIFKKLDALWPHSRRIPIFGLVLCLALSYIAEVHFGIANITGAYIAGIILCSIKDSEYIAEKMDINSYIIFGPIFFASIGLKTELHVTSSKIILFSLLFIVIALLAKVVGCGLIAKLFRYSNGDALKIGVGMMTRGEVGLIIAQKGLNAGLLDDTFFTPVILLIVISSIITPILLKILYQKFQVST